MDRRNASLRWEHFFLVDFWGIWTIKNGSDVVPIVIIYPKKDCPPGRRPLWEYFSFSSKFLHRKVVLLHLNDTPLLVKLSSICNYITLLVLAHISVRVLLFSLQLLTYFVLHVTIQNVRGPREIRLSFDNHDLYSSASRLLHHLSKTKQSVQQKWPRLI